MMDRDEHDPANDDDPPVCSRCEQSLADCEADGCGDPACPGMAEAA